MSFSTEWRGGAYFPRGSRDLEARARMLLRLPGLTGAMVVDGGGRECEMLRSGKFCWRWDAIRSLRGDTQKRVRVGVVRRFTYDSR